MKGINIFLLVLICFLLFKSIESTPAQYLAFIPNFIGNVKSESEVLLGCTPTSATLIKDGNEFTLKLNGIGECNKNLDHAKRNFIRLGTRSRYIELRVHKKGLDLNEEFTFTFKDDIEKRGIDKEGIYLFHYTYGRIAADETLISFLDLFIEPDKIGNVILRVSIAVFLIALCVFFDLKGISLFRDYMKRKNPEKVNLLDNSSSSDKKDHELKDIDIIKNSDDNENEVDENGDESLQNDQLFGKRSRFDRFISFIFDRIMIPMVGALHFFTLIFIIFVIIGYGAQDKLLMKRNAKYLHNLGFGQLEKRTADFIFVPEKSFIKNGDTFHIFRLDGYDPMVMYLSGSWSAHTAIALWIDSELHICESLADANQLGDAYFPPPWGIHCTDYDTWFAEALHANYHITMTRLSEFYHSRFNMADAIQFYRDTDGSRYGYSSYFTGILDTLHGNLAPPLSPELLNVFIGELERLADIHIGANTFHEMFLSGINKRLNSTCTSLSCIYPIIDAMDKSLVEVLIMPELDSYRYEGKRSLVSSSFVWAMFKEAGLFPGIEMNAAEFVPRDIYQANIWDDNVNFGPSFCEGVAYCQLSGVYEAKMPNINSVSIYPRMNERCGAIPPLYNRLPSNC